MMHRFRFASALRAVFALFTLAGPLPAVALAVSAVDLGSAGTFVVLAKTAVTTTGATAVTGNVGISPAAASFLTGFGLILDSSNTFATSSLVTGRLYAADYAAPTPTVMTTAIGDMETAYTNAAGRTNPDGTELYAGIIGGQTFTPGLYKWGTGVSIPTDVTLDGQGSASAVFIFQISGDLSIASATKVLLIGSAQAKNVFWQVAGPTGATLGTTSVFNGNILSAKQIILSTGATLNGRALAQTQVTLDANAVSLPSGSCAAVLAATTAAPKLLALHQVFAVVLTVKNLGATAATGVTPALVVNPGAGFVTAVAAPSPAGPIASLAAGASADFTWTFTATAPGVASFRASAATCGGGLTFSAVQVSATVQEPPAVTGKAIVYPSPARGEAVHVAYRMLESGTAAIRIWNENGDLAASLDEAKAAGPQESLIPIVDFAGGVYLSKVVLTYSSGTVERLKIQKFSVIR